MISNEYIQSILSTIQKYDATPIVYGSVGVSQYLGHFKECDDVDILINDGLVTSQWNQFKMDLLSQGWIMIDEKEHEFIFQKQKVSFASKDILLRDGIITDFSGLVQWKNSTARTLSPEDFLKAYTFSAKDGYRIHQRKKKDILVIDLLKEYLHGNV